MRSGSLPPESSSSLLSPQAATNSASASAITTAHRVLWDLKLPLLLFAFVSSVSSSRFRARGPCCRSPVARCPWVTRSSAMPSARIAIDATTPWPNSLRWSPRATWSPSAPEPTSPPITTTERTMMIPWFTPSMMLSRASGIFTFASTWRFDAPNACAASTGAGGTPRMPDGHQPDDDRDRVQHRGDHARHERHRHQVDERDDVDELRERLQRVEDGSERSSRRAGSPLPRLRPRCRSRRRWRSPRAPARRCPSPAPRRR